MHKVVVSGLVFALVMGSLQVASAEAETTTEAVERSQQDAQRGISVAKPRIDIEVPELPAPVVSLTPVVPKVPAFPKIPVAPTLPVVPKISPLPAPVLPKLPTPSVTPSLPALTEPIVPIVPPIPDLPTPTLPVPSIPSFDSIQGKVAAVAPGSEGTLNVTIATIKDEREETVELLVTPTLTVVRRGDAQAEVSAIEVGTVVAAMYEQAADGVKRAVLLTLEHPE